MGQLERRWAVEEFGAAKLGDARRTARLVVMAVGVARAPGGKVSEVFRDEAEQQGVYDLVDVMAATLSRFDETGAKAWVVADREADARTILLELAGRSTHRFTIRSSWNRRLDVAGQERAYLRQTLQRQRVFAPYKLDVPAGPKRISCSE